MLEQLEELRGELGGLEELLKELLEGLVGTAAVLEGMIRPLVFKELEGLARTAVLEGLDELVIILVLEGVDVKVDEVLKSVDGEDGVVRALVLEGLVSEVDDGIVIEVAN